MQTYFSPLQYLQYVRTTTTYGLLPYTYEHTYRLYIYTPICKLRTRRHNPVLPYLSIFLIHRILVHTPCGSLKWYMVVRRHTQLSHSSIASTTWGQNGQPFPTTYFNGILPYTNTGHQTSDPSDPWNHGYTVLRCRISPPICHDYTHNTHLLN